MIALACDHGGFELMGLVKQFLDEHRYKYKEFGTFSTESVDYPTFAVPAGHAVAEGSCDRGIFICGTGIGMSIAANKIPGIRAALCTTAFMAEMSRCHNDANVLCLGARVLDVDAAIMLVRIFLNTGFEGGRHSLRVAMLDKM
ncbi:MAG: ribose 5-phosphate isomerase B [Oscillospiraceae bacterium]|nr:ribose 5-phosphate isomerase B [Oscillospiraceae bacterium]